MQLHTETVRLSDDLQSQSESLLSSVICAYCKQASIIRLSMGADPQKKEEGIPPLPPLPPFPPLPYK